MVFTFWIAVILIAEFLHYFVNGVLKLYSPPVVVLYIVIVALSPLWNRLFPPLQLRKVRIRKCIYCNMHTELNCAILIGLKNVECPT